MLHGAQRWHALYAGWKTTISLLTKWQIPQKLECVSTSVFGKLAACQKRWSPLCDTNFLSLNCENWIVSFKIHQWLTLTKTYPSLAYDIVVTTWWHCGTTMPTKIKWLWQICSWNQTQQALSLKWMSCMRVIFARVGQMLTLSWPEFNHSSAACDNN